MTRFLLLVPFLAWLVWTPDPAAAHISLHATTRGALIFFAGYLGLVMFMRLWSRIITRHIDSTRFQFHLRWFNRTMALARFLVVKWFVLALFIPFFSWGWFVNEHLGFLRDWPLTLPGMIFATLPAYVAWMGLWWSQYPAERALREQGLLAQLESDLPIHSPPSFWSFFAANLRMQVLFMLVPVMAILLLRDVSYVILWKAGAIVRDESKAEPMILFAATAIVFTLAPLMLAIILRTQSLPESSLRRRLEDMCRRTRLRYRDILLWQTDNNMGNAAVMGIVPQVRYILLSDLLLESMTDEQVEAVFAHEVGHVVHRHMAWYVVLTIILMLGMSVAQVSLEPHLPRAIAHVDMDVLINLIGAGVFILTFGFLSRRFERQADVYAARTIEREAALKQPSAADYNYVGPHGAAVFASALHRVAVVNNIPISARNFTHGSIAARMNYLRGIASDPKQTGKFDRFMFTVYSVMIFALAVFGGFAWIFRDRLMG